MLLAGSRPSARLLSSGGLCMSARRLSARALVLALVIASVAVSGGEARAAGQTITATILLASNGGGVARREWNASGGAINGVNGYVITLDPAEVGTYFTLDLASSNSGVGAPSIAFYTDMTNGITCSTFDGTPGTAGVVCGNHAIVYTGSGANLTFTYQSGMAVPPPPPFVASKFVFTAPIALPFAGSTSIEGSPMLPWSAPAGNGPGQHRRALD